MAGARVDLNIAAFDEIRRSPAVVDLLQQHAETIKERAMAGVTTAIDQGVPFDSELHYNPSRAVVIVGTANMDGMLAEARQRALTRAIG